MYTLIKHSSFFAYHIILIDVEYFLVKSWTYENVEISQSEVSPHGRVELIEKMLTEKGNMGDAS
jgi:hypothetical protein